ncbi:uncharacterized protein LOC115973478 [Quercus lobata]|uniref:uncharacterized protein LOC115973478 n=1 Tax=Quercus lobata TaxID=97700 RepID=UPI001243D6D3|nr:uncharacterized protein LOC115973478 [Quercus lobata]
MYPDLYKGLRLKPKDLTTYDSPLISFEEKTVIPKGQIRLPIQAGSEMVEVDIIVVDAYSPYMAIVARPWLHTMEAVSSTLHQKVKYLLGGHVEEIQSKPPESSACGPTKEPKCEDLEKFVIGGDLEKFFQVRAQLPPQEKEELLEFLRRNIDVFAWDTYEASGVDPNFIYHHLNVNPSITPKKKLPRRPSKKHVDAVREEVIKLKQAGAINEVFYPE